MSRVFEDIRSERIRQDQKWGIQNHDPCVWITILQEEIGEFAQEALRHKFGRRVNGTQLREELVQVAAVATAMIECLDRDSWSWE